MKYTKKESRKLCDDATEKEWFVEEFINGDGEILHTVSVNDPQFGPVVFIEGVSKKDADFIAAARTGWPESLDHEEKSEAKIEELERVLNNLCDEYVFSTGKMDNTVFLSAAKILKDSGK